MRASATPDDPAVAGAVRSLQRRGLGRDAALDEGRQALRDDYVATYARFIQTIRARQPQAFVILLAPPSAENEIAAQVDRVAETLKAQGETRLAVIPVGEMELTGCDWHPSARDQQGISARLSAFLDQRPELWQGR